MESSTTVEPVEQKERPVSTDVANHEPPHVAPSPTVEPAEKEERPGNTETPPPAPAESTEKEERPMRPGLRPPKPPNFHHKLSFTQIHQCNKDVAQSWGINQDAIESMPSPAPEPNSFTPPQMQSIHKAMIGLMFTQMSATKGIKKHGQGALDALRKEFLQFRALDVLDPLDAFTLTDEQKD
jgi:hypothetical protein